MIAFTFHGKVKKVLGPWSDSAFNAGRCDALRHERDSVIEVAFALLSESWGTSPDNVPHFFSYTWDSSNPVREVRAGQVFGWSRFLQLVDETVVKPVGVRRGIVESFDDGLMRVAVSRVLDDDLEKSPSNLLVYGLVLSHYYAYLFQDSAKVQNRLVKFFDILVSEYGWAEDVRAISLDVWRIFDKGKPPTDLDGSVKKRVAEVFPHNFYGLTHGNTESWGEILTTHSAWGDGQEWEEEVRKDPHWEFRWGNPPNTFARGVICFEKRDLSRDSSWFLLAQEALDFSQRRNQEV